MPRMRKEDIQEQLNHHYRMLEICRRYLRELDVQRAQLGLNAGPPITNQIADYKTEIADHESEVDRLETLLAEDELPLAEIEYRARLAELLQSEFGHIGVAKRADLELLRLRLKLTSERTEQIEQELRQAFVHEILDDMKALVPGPTKDLKDMIATRIHSNRMNGEFHSYQSILDRLGLLPNVLFCTEFDMFSPVYQASQFYPEYTALVFYQLLDGHLLNLANFYATIVREIEKTRNTGDRSRHKHFVLFMNYLLQLLTPTIIETTDAVEKIKREGLEIADGIEWELFGVGYIQRISERWIY